ncbi:MAG: electron transport complex subunit RsxB, partial [Casimicrobiaceae bacterium]|nr:electron transport complex subunit RsxB [Casimicrobiaceae bacterium]
MNENVLTLGGSRAGSGTVEQIDACLPQTQCRRCGYADCHAYAEAIHAG